MSFFETSGPKPPATHAPDAPCGHRSTPTHTARPQYKTVSVLAVTAFIMTVFFWPAALILGPMALTEIKNNPNLTGHGLAVWSTFISLMAALCIPIALIVWMLMAQSVGSPLIYQMTEWFNRG